MEFHSERTEGRMGQTAKREIPVEHQALSFMSLPLKSQSTLCSPKCQPFFRMGFSEYEFRVPTKILQRFSKDCIFSFDYHMFHSYRLLTASCLSLASLLCPRQAIAATKGGFIFDRPCTGSSNCSGKCNLLVCLLSRPLVLVGPWFWWGWGLRW